MKMLPQLNAPLFWGLTEAETEELIIRSQIVNFNPGDKLLKEQEQGEEFYVILEGEVTVYKHDPLSGKPVTLSTLHPGAVVGEMAIITKQPRSATVQATIPTAALLIDLSQLAKDPQTKTLHDQLMHNLAKELSQKLLYLDDQIVKRDASYPSVESTLEPTAPPRTILVLLGWRWSDILHEIPFLAKHGYDAIKLSPPQEFAVIPGAPWWAIYQPVSYQLSQFYGTPEELIALIDLCHNYGIRVYVDLVVNHMADYDERAASHYGTNGTPFSRYHYGPLNSDQDYYEFDDFYHFDPQGNRRISDHDYQGLTGIWRLEHYDLLSLPKLKLDSPRVITILRKYVQSLLAMGIDGFRIDAAKHLNSTAVAQLFSGLITHDGLKPFLYQEYYADAPIGIDLHSFMERYFKQGYVTSFKYGDFIADALRNHGNNLQKLIDYSFGGSWIHYPENRAVVVIDNHDTERLMPQRLNYRNQEQNAYVLAYIFMLAWPFGIPKIMSSFRFGTNDDPIPTTSVWQDGRCRCFDPGSPWVAQHRWDAIANMVLFRSRVADAPGISQVWTNGDQIAFARVRELPGSAVTARGFVVINNTAAPLCRNFETGLPAGNYYNLITSHLTAGKLHGPTFQIKKYGKTTIEVPPYDAVVLAVGLTET